jgi:iron complex transport system ATP-binding protein
MFEVCILAGGKSSRMGTAKAELRLDGLKLIDWAKRIARGAGLSWRVIDHDLEESRGPVSGVRTALKTSRAKFIIFLSCDMPFVRSSTLRRMMELKAPVFVRSLAFSRQRVKNSKKLAGFPFMLQKKSPVVGQTLQDLATSLKVERLQIPEAETFNINTPADFRTAQRLFKTNQSVLDVDALSIRRGVVEILRNVDWRVQRGEHWAILGANGSGKTSLLSALTGYLSATSGRIRLLGREFGRADWRELRKHVGLVSSALRQLMAEGETALETVASGKEAMIDLWHPLKGAEQRRARAILNEIGCGHLEKRVWAVLSQGERQRVLIGRALMARPQALILDEPCAGLDPAAREHFLEFIQALTAKRTGPSVILVTHHVEEIVEGITHVLALKKGEVVGAGPKKPTLTSALLSKIFDCKARLTVEGGRFGLRVSSVRRRVM